MRSLSANTSRRIARRRTGALLSAELLLVFPIVVALLFAVVEFSLVLAGQHQIELASQAGARAGSLPGDPEPVDANGCNAVVEDAVIESLGDDDLFAQATLDCDLGVYTGDVVRVKITLPMTSVAPDLLLPLGFSIADRTLQAETVLRKE